MEKKFMTSPDDDITPFLEGVRVFYDEERKKYTSTWGDLMEPNFFTIRGESMEENKKNHPIYLGDGVYFVRDSFQSKIYTSDGVNETNVIYLDIYVAEELSEKLLDWLNKK